MPRFVQYEHHGEVVWVREALKGHHRFFCLCHKCKRFHPGEKTNCPTAEHVFSLCRAYGLVTPVWECRAFQSAEGNRKESLDFS